MPTICILWYPQELNDADIFGIWDRHQSNCIDSECQNRLSIDKYRYVGPNTLNNIYTDKSEDTHDLICMYISILADINNIFTCWYFNMVQFISVTVESLGVSRYRYLIINSQISILIYRLLGNEKSIPLMILGIRRCIELKMNVFVNFFAYKL